MVKVRELHYELEKIVNRLHTGWFTDTSAVDIDSYLNHSKDIILERYTELVEKNKTVESHLKELEKYTDAPLIFMKKGLGSDIFKLPEDYYSHLRVIAKACDSSEKCKEPQEIKTKSYTQQDDLNESLKDPFRKPSWHWRRGVYNFHDKGLEFFHDYEYILKGVDMAYIRYLPDVAYADGVKGGRYLKADGETAITENINLELSRKGTLWRRIVKVASYLIHKDLDDDFKGELESYLFDQNVGVA